MVVLQEALILKVMEDFELDPEEVSETMAFINSYDEDTSSLGGYKLSTGFLIGLPNMMNYSSVQVLITFLKKVSTFLKNSYFCEGEGALHNLA